nr:hypothetical protein [Tanacetum cinerariifolium]
MEDTMLELVKFCQEKELLCIHDDIDDLIESALNSKLLLINSNSQRLDKKEQEVKNMVEQPAKCGNLAPILSTKEPEHLLRMGYEHLSITSETKSDEVTKSNAENLLPIPSECEVGLEDKKECDLPISENSSVCDNHSDIFSDSKIDDDISVYDDDFEDVEYVEASLPILRFIIRLISNIESLNDNSTPDCVLNSFESDNSLLDNFSPEFETFCDHTKETRSGNTTHANYSLPEYDSFCFEIESDQERLINLMKNDISDSSNDPLLEEDNPSIPRPPPKPPDVEIDAGDEIPVVMNDKDKFDDDYQIFMLDKVFSLLSAESEDTIFDPGIFD